MIALASSGDTGGSFSWGSVDGSAGGSAGGLSVLAAAVGGWSDCS